jgi:hypothetical protein
VSHRLGKTALGALGAVALAVLAPAAASAAKIGSDLPAPSDNTGFGCGVSGKCTVIQTGLADSNPYPTKAKFDGVITDWRLRHGVAVGDYEARVRVAKKLDQKHWKFIDKTSWETIHPVEETSHFDTHMKIKKGQFIALDFRGEVDPYEISREAGKSAIYLSFFPAPPMNDRTPRENSDKNVEFLYNATVSRPG